MNLTERDRSAIGGGTHLEHLHTFEQFPVFMGCMKQPAHADLKQDMDWWICRDTGLIQLKHLIPLDVLYPESHGAGVIGELWRRHHRALAEFVAQVAPRSVLEIGGAHGILAKEYQDMAAIPWTILEPNPTPVEGCNARIIKGFFDGDFQDTGSFDAVVHSHVFEHMYRPEEFMRDLSANMAQGQHLVFSVPNLRVMLERKFTNFVNFEHTIYLTEPYIEHLLAGHGFRLLSRAYFLPDHSIFYAAVRDPSVTPEVLPQGLYETNKQLYLDYLQYHRDLIRDMNRRMESAEGPVYLFGAHVFAQYLIAFGLNTGKITAILDNDPKKQDKRLYGTDLMVRSPKVLQGLQHAAVILKAGVFNDEIRSDILGNINPQCVFLE